MNGKTALRDSAKMKESQSFGFDKMYKNKM